ncbi:MAG TPA: V-type ATP synthase subunit D, partial [Verrucomicrobiota bacterium]|nr:V-type ATP synthase subunit D [Verrucomicrobiota bacterium]
MPKLNVPPTKSRLLALKRQLAFAEEGYDLLDQKRQILVFELMSRLDRAQEAEGGVEEALRRAYDALGEAVL